MAGPLSGVRVLELAAIGPAPFAGALLGDLGADVVRVDRLPVPGAVVEPPPRYDFYNRSKRSIALDLKQPAGLQTALQSRPMCCSKASVRGSRSGSVSGPRSASPRTRAWSMAA